MAKKFTAQNVLTLALEHVGYTENGDNITKFAQHFGVKQAQWCGFFIDWLFAMNGGHEPRTNYTPAGAVAYQSLHRYMTVGDPKAGDLVYFDFPNDGIERISHVGLFVRKLSDGRFLCIEGNTSPTDDGDQRNGGCVAVKARSRNTIVGWARPHYEADHTPVVQHIVDLWRDKKLPHTYKGDLESKPAQTGTKSTVTGGQNPTKKAAPTPAKKVAKAKK